MRLFDTTFIIDLVNNQPRAIEKARKIDAENDIPAVSVVTVYEYLLGIHLAYYKSAHLGERLDMAKRDLSPFQPLPLTPEMAEEASRLEAEAVRKGRPIGTNDLYIAATALQLKLSLVTRNTRDFESIPGLKLEAY